MARNPLLNKTSATPENALTLEERDEFLGRVLDGRLATNRGDGWWHITPIWYLWVAEDDRFYLTLGQSRRHLKNLRRDPHVSICVDVDPRPEQGLAAGTKCAICFGTAELTELSDDDEFVRTMTERIVRRYVGDEFDTYRHAIWSEDRIIATITPVRWLTWDQTKG